VGRVSLESRHGEGADRGGANANTPNRYGITPLLQAARSGDAALVGALLKAGPTLAVTHPDGETPLMAASRSGHPMPCKLLARAGADVNAADMWQEQTALMWAAAEGHLDVVEALLKAGADPNRSATSPRSRNGSTPIIRPADSRR
jgi:ankyrin repeat protein